MLGTGVVGRALALKLVERGHQVMMGSRTPDNENARAWAKAAGKRASQGTFADAAEFGAIVFNCTAGVASLEALALAGAEHLRGKVLVDVANPLDASHGMPPTLTVCNTDSLGEQIQRALPEAKVVKSLNTLNYAVMVNPALAPGDHDVFVCGNDAAAKAQVTELLVTDLGWKRRNVIDLGDITMARGTEMWLALWIRLFAHYGHSHFNLHLQVGSKHA